MYLSTTGFSARVRLSRLSRTSWRPPALTPRSSTLRSGPSRRWQVSDPEQKRKIIGREFIRVFEQAAREVVEDAGAHGQEVEFSCKATLYPDVVESGGWNRCREYQEPPQCRRSAG